MSNFPKYLILLASLLFIAPVMAVQEWGLPSCWAPEVDTLTGYYEFADGLNNSATFTGTTNVSGASLNSTILIRLGAQYSGTNLTKLYGIQWMNATTNHRGLAYLFRNTTFYYAVFQYDGKVWGIPGLTKYTYGNSTWYSNGIETVLFNINGTGLTAAKESRRWSQPAGANDEQYAILYKFGNTSIKNVNTETCTAPGSGTCATHAYSIPIMEEGYIEQILSVTPGAWSSLCFRYTQSGNSTAVGVNSNLTGTYVCPDATTGEACSTAGVGCLDEYEIDYWDCAPRVGSVFFTAYAGSDVCVAYESLPDLSCQIDGDTYVIPASSATESNVTSYVPIYKLILEEYVDYWRIGFWPRLYDLSNDGFLIAYKSKSHASQLSFGVVSPDEQITLWEYLFGAPISNLVDVRQVFYVEYGVPGGNVDAIPLTSITLNTTLETGAMKCECQWWGSCDNYTLEYVAGYNTTHWKYTNATCRSGTLTTNTPFLFDDITTTLTQQQIYTFNLLFNVENPEMAPIWKKGNASEGAVARSFMVWLVFHDDTDAVYVGDLTFGDNENFEMNFSLTTLTISGVESDKYAYGSYFYMCEKPPGFIVVEGNSNGWVTINEPIEYINLLLQEERSLWLELYLKYQGTNALNGICIANTGVVDVTGLDGLCNISSVSTYSRTNVSTTYFDTNRNATFCVGDFYNSEGYGIGPRCRDFTGAYVYEWELENELTNVEVTVKMKDGTLVTDASVYWDGTYLDTTLADGTALFEVSNVFCYHDLSIQHDCFRNNSATVRLVTANNKYEITVFERSGCNYLEDYVSQQPITTSEQALGLMSNRNMLGVLVLIGAGYAGSAGGLPGIALTLSAAALLLAFGNMIPWTWATLIIALSVILGAVSVRGVFTKKEGQA